jgi:hypothetical protein
MKLLEFITNELTAFAEADIRLSYRNGQSKMLLGRVKNLLSDIDEEDFDFEGILTTVKNDEQLNSLRTFRWHIEELARINMYYGTIIDLPSDEFIEADIKKVSELILSQPGNRLLPLFWLIYKMESFKASESFTREIVSFYEVIFEEYSYLVELEDFFKRTNLLYQSWLVENPEVSFFIPVFRKAIARFPEKLVLKLSVARFMHDNQDYNASVEVLKSVCNQTENLDNFPEIGPQDSYFYDDYIYAKQFLAINYDKLGDPEMVQHYADQVIGYFYESGGEDNLSYSDSFLLRMRINISKSDFLKVREDYVAINSCLDMAPGYFHDEYGDVMSFVERDGNR